MALGLIFLSEFFVDNIWLSVCKRISLDGNYFMVIFMLENWDLAIFSQLQNKVKNTKIISK